MLLNALREVIENQIRDGAPPATKATYERLLREGVSSAEAEKMLISVLFEEMNTMMQNDEDFKEERYTAALNALPDLGLGEDE